MAIPMLNVARLEEPLRSDLIAITNQVISSGYYINGPAVKEWEHDLAEYCHVKHAIAVSSGTDALIAAMMAMDVKPGDEVITTPYTFFATAGSIHRVGATPVFVDIEPDTYNIDPYKIEAAITDKTVGIIPVHLYGQCADMDPILEIVSKNKLWVLEDAAQSIGATYKDKMAGSMGTAGIYSFFPGKNLGCLGDGGAVVTNDDKLAEQIFLMRNHGAQERYFHHKVGGNFRMDTIQAAALMVKLPHLKEWVAGRSKVARLYDDLFAENERVITPVVKPQCKHVRNQYIVRVPADKRQVIMETLQGKGIGCAIYYPLSLHMQQCFAYVGNKEGDFPESERAARETLALPVDPNLSDDEVKLVAQTVLSVL